jgi:hypothetical protein
MPEAHESPPRNRNPTDETPFGYSLTVIALEKPRCHASRGTDGAERPLVLLFASFLSPETEDQLATILALFILFVVPIVLIVLFWLVHVLPEKIAHKRHHPQFEAIRTLCLLSLVFGGLLWPLAWLWAYSKPVMYKMAYGTDKHPDVLEGGGSEAQ